MQDVLESDLPLTLSQPAVRALFQAGWVRLDQVAGRRERELLALHGMGPKALEQIRQALAERGLSFAPEAAPVDPT